MNQLISIFVFLSLMLTDTLRTVHGEMKEALAKSSMTKEEEENEFRMRVKYVRYDNCINFDDPKIEVKRRVLKEPKEDPDKPGCYRLNLKLENITMLENVTRYELKKLYVLSENRLGPPSEMKENYTATYITGQDTVTAELARRNFSRYSDLEPCEFTDQEIDENNGETPTCGGFGSCLSCGDDCKSVAKEAKKLATFKILSARNKKKLRRGKGKKLNCNGALRKNQRFFSIRYCPPTFQELLDHFEVTEDEWNQVYQDGEQVRSDLYMFYDKSGDMYIKNQVKFRRQWLDRTYDGFVNDMVPERWAWYYMEDAKTNALSCVTIKANLHKPKDKNNTETTPAPDPSIFANS